MSYTIDRLLSDVSRARGPLSKKEGADYEKVWDAFNRYVTEALDKRQTVNVANFCKIGWKVEEQTRGKVRLRPHFQAADQFLRAHGLETKSHPSVSDKCLTQLEEFNFSKAAIRYSQSLSKDNIFMGLRAIIGQLGDVMASGQQVSIDFEVGKMVCNQRDVQFFFIADFYLREGLDVPSSSVEGTGYQPSTTFAPPSKDALSMSLQGSNQFPGSGNVTAIHMGGWDDTGPPIVSFRDVGSDCASEMGGRSEVTGYAQSAVSQLSRLEQVHDQGLQRHIAGIERQAEAAVAEKELWEHHLVRCIDEEKKDLEWRKALNKDYSDGLKRQMRQAEERRTVGREHSVQQASQHDFPDFTETPEQQVYEYIRSRRLNLKEDLDQQVDTKQRMKDSAKQRERELEQSHIEASQRELALIKLEAAAKREEEKATLAYAWEKDKRLQNVKKAIENHHKAPAMRSDLSTMVQSTLSDPFGDTGHGAAGVPKVQMGATMASPRYAASDGGSAANSSRCGTGSIRRKPIGAAASLALHKQRMGTTMR